MINSARRQFLRGKPKNPPLRAPLPWQVEEQDFLTACTRCELCIDNCPQHIIVKGDGGYPSMNFQQAGCTYCYRCAESCKEPIFHPQSEPAWSQLAHIKPTVCLTTQGVMCRHCEESCDVFAIRFKPALGGIAKPDIDSDSCHGCGACQSSCPVNAISIDLIIKDKTDDE